MLPTRDPLQGKGHTQIESEGMEKRYFMQMEMTRKWGSNGHIRQDRVKNKGHKER